MKTTSSIRLFFLIVVSLALSHCSKDNPGNGRFDMDTLTFERSMKGWELYSWPGEKDWNYSLLMGTNRIKTLEEVTGNRIVVAGTVSLEMLLGKLPENEEIFWVGRGWLQGCWGGSYGDLALPESKIIQEIKEFCTREKLVLRVDH